jgi:hypothetical protein
VTSVSTFRETYPDPNRILADDMIEAMGSEADPSELSDIEIAMLVDSMWADLMTRAQECRA